MDVYRMTGLPKVFFVASLVSVLIFGSLLLVMCLFDAKVPSSHWLVVLTLIAFGVFGFATIGKTEIRIDEEKIELRTPIRVQRPILRRIFRQGGLLQWSEVAALIGSGRELRLFPRRDSHKPPLDIPLFGIPLELVREVFRRVPPETKICLDTRLKRGLEGKQTWFYRKEQLHVGTKGAFLRAAEKPGKPEALLGVPR